MLWIGVRRHVYHNEWRNTISSLRNMFLFKKKNQGKGFWFQFSYAHNIKLCNSQVTDVICIRGRLNTGIKRAPERGVDGGRGAQERGDACILGAHLHCYLAKPSTTSQGNFPPILKCCRKTERIMLSAQNVKLYCRNVKTLRLSSLFMYYCSCLIAVA